MPPTAPPKPQIPVTELTARRGTISETRVKMLAAQPQWPAMASEISPVASQGLETSGASTIGKTTKGHANMASLRAALWPRPCSEKSEYSQPPKIPPTLENRYMAATGRPIRSSFKPNCEFKNFGPQYR